MDERLFQVILAIIPVLGTIVTYFVVPIYRLKLEMKNSHNIKNGLFLQLRLRK